MNKLGLVRWLIMERHLTKSDDLSSIPKTHMLGSRTNTHKVVLSPQSCTVAHTSFMHTQNKTINKSLIQC